jgi:hypothetical protein
VNENEIADRHTVLMNVNAGYRTVVVTGSGDLKSCDERLCETDEVELHLGGSSNTIGHDDETESDDDGNDGAGVKVQQ